MSKDAGTAIDDKLRAMELAPIAEVRRRKRAQLLIGPSPLYGKVPEWLKGADCKSAGYAFGGSNPPLPTGRDSDVRSAMTGTVDYPVDGREPAATYREVPDAAGWKDAKIWL